MVYSSIVRRILTVLLGVGVVGLMQAAVYDNRAWPLFPKPVFLWQETPTAPGFLNARMLFLGASDGYVTDDAPEGVFAFWGAYDEVVLNTAVQKAGLVANSPLPPPYQSLEAIPWTAQGRIALRGCMAEGEAMLNDWVSIGGSFFAGNQTATQLSTLVGTITPDPGPGDRALLREVNGVLQDIVQAAPHCYRAASMGDINCYLRGYVRKEYWYKFHHIDFACSFGLLAPTAGSVSQLNPVGMPLGWNGLMGLYAQFDCQAVLKSELSAGLSLQICQRLPKTASWRMPVLTEPSPYGAAMIRARYSPGVTVAFTPYVQVSGLRDGFGLAGGYYLVRHFSDHWTPVQPQSLVQLDGAVTPNLALLQERSVWGRDMFSVSAFYDFGYECASSWYRPLISISVDIPWKGPVTERVPQTHAISIRIESRV